MINIEDRRSLDADLTELPAFTLSYRMRAEHAGQVGALPSTVELMYEPRHAANSAERKMKVIRK